ncbi:MAG: hypothetical protein ACREBD_34315, partial [Blastocatellia bacterium]
TPACACNAAIRASAAAIKMLRLTFSIFSPISMVRLRAYVTLISRNDMSQKRGGLYASSGNQPNNRAIGIRLHAVEPA